MVRISRRIIVAAAVLAVLGSAPPMAAASHAAGPGPATSQAAFVGKPLPAWRPGMLDIHHIYTGRGNSTFFVLPDGTTMLVDAGALRDDWGKGDKPLKLAAAAPDESKRPGEWIADYIAQFAPPGMRGLDYALITHFHEDHFGALRPDSPKSARGDWRLTGITAVAERWPIATLIDRDYPTYDFPVRLRDAGSASLKNYFRFVDANVRSGAMKAQHLEVGRDDQIRLVHNPKAYPGFVVRDIAANGVVWTGKGTTTRATLSAKQITDAKGKYNENPLSCVIKLSYGPFDYVTGGDFTGVNAPDKPAWFNMESKAAPAIGAVDAITLDHHGNRDATNADWLRTLQPRVMVEQTWVSDQPGGEVVQRIASRTLWPGPRDVFATHIAPETAIAIGPVLERTYKSEEGHVVIRVQPGGREYDVFILDDASSKRLVTAHFGPYRSR